MSLTPEDEKLIRLIIRQEINKAVGSILVAARKTNIKDIRNFAANTKFIENTLINGLHRAEADLKGETSTLNENDLYFEHERLGTYDD